MGRKPLPSQCLPSGKSQDWQQILEDYELHKLECAQFSPDKDQANVQKVGDYRCVCGEIFRKHSVFREIISPTKYDIKMLLQNIIPVDDYATVNRTDGNDKPIISLTGDVRDALIGQMLDLDGPVPAKFAQMLANRDQFFHKAPTNGLGVLDFKTADTKPAKYVRVSTDDSPKSVFDFLKNEWQMMKPEEPQLVISVSGGAKNFSLDPTHKRKIHNALVTVAESTCAWFITSGFGFGVMKLVGAAVRDSQSYNKSSEEGFTHKIKCIGVGPWGCVDKREQLETMREKSGTHYELPKVPYYPCRVSHARYSPMPLDANHTHFILIDNGFRNRFTGPGNISEFRAKFQSIIAKEMNMVMLLIEGGVGIIDEVFNSLGMGVPVVVCEGTCRAADIIAEIYHAAADSNKLNDYQWRPIQSRLNALDDMRDELLPECMFKLKEIAKSTHLITIFNIHRNDDLINCLLQALCTARDDPESDLKLALSCNRGQFAEMKLFKETSNWSTDFLHEMMEQALNENKLAFVKLLIEHGVQMHDFLTVGRLTQLYKDNLQKLDVLYLHQRFRHWAKHDIAGDNFHIAVIGSMLGHLVFGNNPARYSCGMQDRSQKIAGPYNELFIWAVLMNRHELAIYFWEKGIQPVATALGGTWLYNALIKNTDSVQEEMLQKFQANKDHFEKLAIESLDAMYERYPDEALKLLDNPVTSWSDMTCIKLAAAASDMAFLSTVACQTHLKWKWRGDIQSHTYKVFLAVLFPFLMCSLIRFKKKPSKQTSRNVMKRFSQFCMMIQQFYTAPLVKYITFVLWYLAFLLVYTYMVLFDIREEVSTIQIVCFIWVCSCICDQIHRCMWLPFPTMKSRVTMWLDWVHVCHLVNPIVAFGNFFLHFSLPFLDVIKMIYCINLALFYLRILKMYTASEFLGPKLQIIQTTTKKLLLFFMILMVFLLAYGTSSNALLFPRLDLTWDTYIIIIRRIMYMPYWQIYGELQLEELETDEDCFAALNITDIQNAPPTHCRTWSRLVPIMLAVYLFFASILLLNLIIAIFSQIYENIENNCMKVWKYQMYFFITEYEVKTLLPLPLNLLEYVYQFIRWLCQRPCRKSIDDSSQDRVLGWLEHETHRKMLLKKENKRLSDETDKFSSLHEGLDKIERRLHNHEQLLGCRQKVDNEMLSEMVANLLASQSGYGTPTALASMIDLPGATSSREYSKTGTHSTFGKPLFKSQDSISMPKKDVFDSNGDIKASDETNTFRPNSKAIRIMSEEFDDQNGYEMVLIHNNDDKGNPSNDGESDHISPALANGERLPDDTSEDETVSDTDKLLANSKMRHDDDDDMDVNNDESEEATVKQRINSDNDRAVLIPLMKIKNKF